MEKMEKVDAGERLNVHYLKAVEEVNGEVVVNNYRIPRPQDAILKLKEMRDDETKTLLDMQAFAETILGPTERNFAYSYVYPNEYSEKLYGNTECPQFLSNQEYLDYVKDLDKKFREKWQEKRNEAEEQGRSFNVPEDEYVRENVETLLSAGKKSFYRDFRLYVCARYYWIARRELMERPEIKMCSTDRHGWPDANKRFQAYKINDDVTISVFTNFAYGNSTYFFLGLTYKGIDILPYSFLVKYYYVKELDVMHYTRNYARERSSWGRALQFVADVSNLAKRDPDRFVREWVQGEVDKMVDGLRVIVSAPRDEMERIVDFYKHYDSAIKKDYISVRNIDSRVHNMFSDEAIKAVLPDELAIVWKAEKITAALNCLEKVAKLAPVYPKVVERIAEVRQMSVDSIPQFDATVNKIERDVADREKNVESLTIDANVLAGKMKPHQDEIQRLKNAFIAAHTDANGECMYEGWVLGNHLARINNNYVDCHPEYSEMCKKYNALIKEIKVKQREINMRNTLSLSLIECRKRILAEKSTAIAA